MAEPVTYRFNRKKKKIEFWDAKEKAWLVLDEINQPLEAIVSEDGLSATVTFDDGMFRVSTDAVPDNELKAPVQVDGAGPEAEVPPPQEAQFDDFPSALAAVRKYGWADWNPQQLSNGKWRLVKRKEAGAGTYPNSQAAAEAAQQRMDLEGKPYTIRELTDRTWSVVAASDASPETLDQAILQALIAGDQAALDTLLALQDRVTPYQEALFAQRQAEFGATLGQRQTEERRRQLEWDMQFGATQQARDSANQQWQAEFGQGQYQFERTQAQRELEAQQQHQLNALQMGLDIQRSPGDLWRYWDMVGSLEPSVPYTPGERVPRTWADQWAQFGGQAARPAGAFLGGMPAPVQQLQASGPFVAAEPAASPYYPPNFAPPDQVAAWLAGQGITPEAGPPSFQGPGLPPTPTPAQQDENMRRQGYFKVYGPNGEAQWAGPEDLDAYLAAGWTTQPQGALPEVTAPGFQGMGIYPTSPYQEGQVTVTPSTPAPTAAAPVSAEANLLPREQEEAALTQQDRDARAAGGQKFIDPYGDIIYVGRDDLYKVYGRTGYTVIPWPGQGISTGGEGGTTFENFENQRREAERLAATKVPQFAAPRASTVPTFAFPGLPPQGWKAPRLEAAFRGQPVRAARQLPSLGAPVFPSGQSWRRLASSEQQAFRGEVESQGFPWPDYMSQWERTRPTWNKTAPFLRRPTRLGVT